ncbi:MAG: phenylacetic acid degradation protein, partial [Haliea sp.]
MMESPEFNSKDDAYAARVHDSFALQGAMGTLGASLAEIT